jgi:hypothetical protein
MSCLVYTGIWKLLYDWQTIITGALAIIAALIGAVAAYRVGNIQLAAIKRRDHLQARCLAVGIAPELLQMRTDLERTKKLIDERLLLAKNLCWPTTETVQLIRDAKIDLPPLLSQSVQQLYLLEKTGPQLLQMIAVTLQYNMMVEKLSQDIQNNFNKFDPPAHQRTLSGHLGVIERNLTDAENSIEPLHDEATAG